MKINKYIISFVFLGLFFIPLTYQHLHILLQSEHHHSHYYPKYVDDQQSIQMDDEEDCPICDYEFFTFPLPKIFIHQLKLFVGKNNFNQQKISFLYQTICSVQIPRAPPLF